MMVAKRDEMNDNNIPQSVRSPHLSVAVPCKPRTLDGLVLRPRHRGGLHHHGRRDPLVHAAVEVVIVHVVLPLPRPLHVRCRIEMETYMNVVRRPNYGLHVFTYIQQAKGEYIRYIYITSMHQ
jgi:hypothetical protein